MATPTALFCPPSVFLIAYDPRRLAQLGVLSDDPGDPLPNNQDLEESPLINFFLGWATEEILLACQVGGRYTRATLEALAADFDATTLRGRGASLIKLCADKAFAGLVQSKGQSKEDRESLAAQFEQTEYKLEQLRLGERVFDDAADIEAGKKVTTQAGIVQNGPRLSDDTGIFGNVGAWRRGYGYRGPNGY